MKKFRIRATVKAIVEQEWQYELYASNEKEAMEKIKRKDFENLVDSNKVWDSIATEDEIVKIDVSDIEEVIE